jgi:hypothetical protein
MTDRKRPARIDWTKVRSARAPKSWTEARRVAVWKRRAPRMPGTDTGFPVEKHWVEPCAHGFKLWC